ncbi:MAG: zinc ribbon domain-containing protein [Thermomicrobiales bacterium]|nr:zinc ribbon domain-containing protein [Thermomicrobiales bacterium]
MRIAILIVGLLLWIIAFVQITLVANLAEWADANDTQTAAGLGFVGLISWLVALIIVLPWPRAAMWLFLVAGGLMLLGSGDFGDLAVWGSIAILLGVFSYVGLRQKRKKDAKESERDAMFAQMVAHQQTMASVMSAPLVAAPAAASPIPVTGESVTCTECGQPIATASAFCPSCGAKQVPTDSPS